MSRTAVVVIDMLDPYDAARRMTELDMGAEVRPAATVVLRPLPASGPPAGPTRVAG